MKYTSKTKSDFIDGVMDSEHSVYVDGFDESILANPWNRNLFSVFKTKEEVKEYLYNL
jgi:hypothetical protein